MRTYQSRLQASFLLSLLLALVFCAPAYPDSLVVKKAEAARVEAQVGVLNEKAGVAAEKYNAARARYETLTQKVHTTERSIAKLEKRTHVLQTDLNARANDAYRKGPNSFLPVLLSARTFDDFNSTVRVLTTMNEQDASAVAQLKAAKATASKQRATLVSAQKEARRQQSAMAANAKEVESQLDARKRLLAGLTAEIQALVAKRIADQQAAEQARTMALLLAQRSPEAGGITLGGPPPTAKAAAAVYWAEKQIGKPYVWAAAGPDTFDCSGLMVFAYKRVGINLTHYSGAQIHQGASVERSDLQPGDLVFFGSPIHHVGMYVGGGCFLEAPFTGSEVHISRLSDRSDFSGACRPAE